MANLYVSKNAYNDTSTARYYSPLDFILSITDAFLVFNLQGSQLSLVCHCHLFGLCFLSCLGFFYPSIVLMCHLFLFDFVLLGSQPHLLLVIFRRLFQLCSMPESVEWDGAANTMDRKTVCISRRCCYATVEASRLRIAAVQLW